MYEFTKALFLSVGFRVSLLIKKLKRGALGAARETSKQCYGVFSLFSSLLFEERLKLPLARGMFVKGGYKERGSDL